MTRRDVVVVGAGVSGLTVAARLLEEGHRVRIWTDDPPEATNSALAAAIWYPYLAAPEDRVLAWGALAYRRFLELAVVPTSGVIIREGTEVARAPLPGPWWADAVGGVTRAADAELPPGFVMGLRFRVPIVEMPLYLPWLRARVEVAGGTLERRRVSDLTEAGSAADAVVNCAGLGAGELADDPNVQPVRGQVVRVRNPGIDRFLLDQHNPGGVTYVVPRSHDVVCGGTADAGEWDTTPDPATAEDILRRCSALEPRLEGCEVLGHAAGLRPTRPEIRVEREERDGLTIVHDYGHGGAGVTLSWGCAEEVAGLLRR